MRRDLGRHKSKEPAILTRCCCVVALNAKRGRRRRAQPPPRNQAHSRLRRDCLSDQEGIGRGITDRSRRTCRLHHCRRRQPPRTDCISALPDFSREDTWSLQTSLGRLSRRFDHIVTSRELRALSAQVIEARSLRSSTRLRTAGSRRALRLGFRRPVAGDAPRATRRSASPTPAYPKISNLDLG